MRNVYESRELEVEEQPDVRRSTRSKTRKREESKMVLIVFQLDDDYDDNNDFDD